MLDRCIETEKKDSWPQNKANESSEALMLGPVVSPSRGAHWSHHPSPKERLSGRDQIPRH